MYPLLLSEQDEEEIPLDVLTDPEALEKFMEIYLTKINSLEENLEKISDAKKQNEVNLAFFKEKYEILEKYKIFVDSKGFGIIKQTVDEHAAEIREAEKARLAEDDDNLDDFCTRGPSFFGDSEKTRQQYSKKGFCTKSSGCLRPNKHRGKCTDYNT